MSTPARSAPARSTSARSTSVRSTSARSAASRPSRATRVRRPALSTAPAPRASVAGNGVFALVVIGILLTGMVLLLVLNTTLAQGAFEIGALTQSQNQLAVTEQQLLQAVAAEEAPESLQKRAGALGMVPVTSPVFLRLADGAVLGTPTPAAAPRARAAAPATAPATAAAAATATTTKTTKTDPMTAVPVPTAPKATKTTTKVTTKPRTTTSKAGAATSDAAVPVPSSGAGR